MLRDPHADLNLMSFRDYAASRDPNEKYDYSLRHVCACGQFARHIGLWDEWVGAILGDGNNIWAEMNRLAFSRWGGPTTWGALRQRLDDVINTGGQ